jgi:hypothetical protein
MARQAIMGTYVLPNARSLCQVEFAGRTAVESRATVAVVLFLVFGSSGSGKSFSLDVLRRRVSGLAIHDFDEIGVPSDADTAWRHRATERWVRRALEYEADGTDLLLAGQTPFGELLAAPSAPLLEAISACLVDCDDETRLVRLHERGPEWLARSAGDVDDYLNWAEWMRRHAIDPAWRTDVIRLGGDEAMRWERWIGWCAGDPRWRVRVVDTSRRAVDWVADELAAWVDEERAHFREGTHPLKLGK